MDNGFRRHRIEHEISDVVTFTSEMKWMKVTCFGPTVWSRLPSPHQPWNLQASAAMEMRHRDKCVDTAECTTFSIRMLMMMEMQWWSWKL
jgi:hypothetical protein